MMTEKQIRKRFKGKAVFRVVGNERTGYKLVVRVRDENTFKKLDKMEKKLEKIFDVEIVNFI